MTCQRMGVFRALGVSSVVSLCLATSIRLPAQTFAELLQTIGAYRESRILLTAIELDVYTAVGEGATAAEVAAKLKTDERATETLMNALVAMRLLTKRDGVFHNTRVTSRYLVEGSPDNARSALMHTAHLWPRWSALTECVRAGTSVAGEQPSVEGEEWTQDFIAAMHRNAMERAPQVVEAVGVEGVSRLLDIGGGSGAYSIVFAQRSKNLTAEVLDLATVTPIAQGHIERAGLADRITTRVGDLRADEFGDDYDLLFLSHICHMLSPRENRDLFARCYRALSRGGRIVIHDFILQADKTAPKSAALFALHMLVATEAGSSYSDEEYAAWLREAGFQDVRRIPLAGSTGLMQGTRR